MILQEAFFGGRRPAARRFEQGGNRHKKQEAVSSVAKRTKNEQYNTENQKTK